MKHQTTYCHIVHVLEQAIDAHLFDHLLLPSHENVPRLCVARSAIQSTHANPFLPRLFVSIEMTARLTGNIFKIEKKPKQKNCNLRNERYVKHLFDVQFVFGNDSTEDGHVDRAVFDLLQHRL
jgi:hypothetical protein